jgi:very-short-patch-repair endonuclease
MLEMAPTSARAHAVPPYRRDRRKDQLLQEAGYFVLRFLAEDIGKHLDAVLDTIQRTLFSRQTRPS